MQLFQVTGLCAIVAIHQIKRERMKTEESRARNKNQGNVFCVFFESVVFARLWSVGM